MSESAFASFNDLYVGRLSSWGIVVDGTNPVARSNVCPGFQPPAEPCFHAFSFTVKDQNNSSFVRYCGQR